MNNRQLKPFITYILFVIELLLAILILLVGCSDIEINESNSMQIATFVFSIIITAIGNYFLISKYGNKKALHKLSNIIFEEENN